MTITQLKKITEAARDGITLSPDAITQAAKILGHQTQRGTEIRQTHQLQSWAKVKEEQKAKSKS